MHIPVTYRCRAECELDARRLLEQIPIGHLVSMDIEKYTGRRQPVPA